MAKRESRQKSRQSVAIRGEDKWLKGDRDTDRDTLRRVREWAVSARSWPTPHDDFDKGFMQAAAEVLAILNGTERKGEKRG